MAVIQRARQGLEQGAPAGLLFLGDDGSGRTYWLDWLAQVAREWGWVVVTARCDERAQDNPYQPFFSALGLTFDKNGEIINDRSVASVVDLIPLPDVISAVSNIPGIGAVVAFGLIGKAVLDQQRRPLEGEALLNRNFEFIRQTFVQVHKRQHKPILLCLDDLHRASRTTFALIRHTLVNNPDVPLLVAGTWNSREPLPGDLVGLLEQHALMPLSRTDAERLVARLEAGEQAGTPAGTKPSARPSGWRLPFIGRGHAPAEPVEPPAGVPAALPADLLHELIEFSHGLPGLIVEGYRLARDGAGTNLLQAAAQDRNLMVRAIAERHLAYVPPETRPLLTCAAQLGQRFPLAAMCAPRMQAYLGLSERRIVESLATLAQEGRVLRYDGEEALAFTSPHLARYLQALPAGPLARHDHLRVAEAGAEADLPPGLLAAHYLAGGDYAEALNRALAAAELRLRDAAYAEAAESYRQALEAFEHLAQPPVEGAPARAVQYRGRPVERVELLRSASFAAERAGDWAQAYDLLALAAPLAGDESQAAAIRMQMGWLAHNQGRMDEALACLSTARARWAATGDCLNEAKAGYYEGVVHIAHKAWTRAAEALEGAVAAAQQACCAGAEGAQEVQALAYLELGNLHRQQRAWAEAEKALSAGRELAERSGDAFAVAQSYHYLGMVYGRQERAEAIPALEQAAAIARERVKQPHLQAMIENTLAETLVRARRWEEAERAFHTSEALKQQIGDVAGLAMTYGGLARMAQRQWRFAEAAEYYRKDLALLERDAAANVAFRQQIHNSLGEVLRLGGRTDEAEAEFAQGLALCRLIPDPAERERSEGYSHLGIARLALDRGDVPRGEREWTAAAPLLRGTWMEPELDRVHAWLLRAQGRYDEAWEALGRCLAVVDARGEDYEKLQAALERARLARVSGRAGELAPAVARAREMAERLQSAKARGVIEREFPVQAD